MTAATQFEPIDRPLDLSPVDFVSRARERGISIERGVYLVPGIYGYREQPCGCAVGTAAALKVPALVECGANGYRCSEALGLTFDERIVISAGFEGIRLNKEQQENPRLVELHAWSLAVARAAGLEEGERKA
jgi:hypothetical protein